MKKKNLIEILMQFHIKWAFTMSPLVVSVKSKWMQWKAKNISMKIHKIYFQFSIMAFSYRCCCYRHWLASILASYQKRNKIIRPNIYWDRNKWDFYRSQRRSLPATFQPRLCWHCPLRFMEMDRSIFGALDLLFWYRKWLIKILVTH